MVWSMYSFYLKIYYFFPSFHGLLLFQNFQIRVHLSLKTYENSWEINANYSLEQFKMHSTKIFQNIHLKNISKHFAFDIQAWPWCLYVVEFGIPSYFHVLWGYKNQKIRACNFLFLLSFLHIYVGLWKLSIE